MRELRLSIPFVGGITAVYTREEVEQIVVRTKTAVKQAKVRTLDGVVHSLKMTAIGLNRVGHWLDPD